MVAGCHVFLPRFTATSATAAVQAGGVNSLALVPTMLHMLVKEAHSFIPDTTMGAAPPLAGVESVVVGGQLMSRGLERLARSSMPKASFAQTYACTEAGSTVTFALSSHLGVFLSPAVSYGSAGKTGVGETTAERKQTAAATGGIHSGHVEIRVIERSSPTSGNAVVPAAPGVAGDVETRGPHVMKGYWGKPGLTAEVLRPDGWLRTGDVGRFDEQTGRLVVVGRAKDVIKTGGETVHASEVESVLLRHVWVAEAAAYGVEDERLGEKVAASVVLENAAHEQTGGISCDRARVVLDGFCGLHLSHYKRPRRIDVVPALPRNSAGKVLRHKLRSAL